MTDVTPFLACLVMSLMVAIAFGLMGLKMIWDLANWEEEFTYNADGRIVRR